MFQKLLEMFNLNFKSITMRLRSWLENSTHVNKNTNQLINKQNRRALRERGNIWGVGRVITWVLPSPTEMGCSGFLSCWQFFWMENWFLPNPTKYWINSQRTLFESESKDPHFRAWTTIPSIIHHHFPALLSSL